MTLLCHTRAHTHALQWAHVHMRINLYTHTLLHRQQFTCHTQAIPTNKQTPSGYTLVQIIAVPTGIPRWLLSPQHSGKRRSTGQPPPAAHRCTPPSSSLHQQALTICVLPRVHAPPHAASSFLGSQGTQTRSVLKDPSPCYHVTAHCVHVQKAAQSLAPTLRSWAGQ